MSLRTAVRAAVTQAVPTLIGDTVSFQRTFSSTSTSTGFTCQVPNGMLARGRRSGVQVQGCTAA